MVKYPDKNTFFCTEFRYYEYGEFFTKEDWGRGTRGCVRLFPELDCEMPLNGTSGPEFLHPQEETANALDCTRAPSATIETPQAEPNC